MGRTASRLPAAKAAIAQIIVPANAIGSIKLRGNPAIQALINCAFTPRLERSLHFVQKERPRTPQLDVSHARNELLDKTAKTLARLLGISLIDRTRPRVICIKIP